MFLYNGGIVLKQWDQLNEQDKQVIIKQIGREPRGVLGVAKRCVYGHPQIIVNRPIQTEGESLHLFPTLYWLTCPYLKKVISHLEGQGMVSTIQEKVNNDPELAAVLEQNHRAHAKKRTALVPDDVLEALAKNYPNEYQVLTESGVGGNRSLEGVKCLHTHLADFLADHENIIGSHVYDMLEGKLNCDSGNCSLED